MDTYCHRMHLQLHVSQYKQKTQHPSHPLHKYGTKFNTPRLLHNKHSHRPPYSHYNRHKNKHAPYTYTYIYISIVSRHLATRGNNKILRTPAPHISSSEEILPRLTCRTLAQLRTNEITLSEIILTQSRRQITSTTTMPPL